MKTFLQLKQNQSLIPMLQQSLYLLQCSSLEIEQEIHNMVLDNPALICDKEHEDYKNTGDLDIDDKQNNFDMEMENDSNSFFSKSYDENIVKLDRFENLSQDKNLKQYLLQQLEFLSLDKEVYDIVYYLIFSLDEDGYLRTSLCDIANDLNLMESQIYKNLLILQNFDPIGVAARNLNECLLIQAKQLENISYKDEIIFLIENSLHLIAKQDYKKISKQLKLNLNDVKYCLEVIKSFNPNPCSIFTPENIQYIPTDLIVYKVNNAWKVRFIDRFNLRLDPNFNSNEILNGKEYIQEAKWFLNSLSKRKDTILKIVNVILEEQEQFFEYGEHFLKPLNLQFVADKIGMHLSTISRAVNNKYISTKFGLFELKFFFVNKLLSENDNYLSSHNIKCFIKDLIDKENKKNPLTDSVIVNLINESLGVKIARRTVAKYRESLQILSSFDRKKIS